ncbi:melanocortin receptor 5-like [Branchiostoma lanceolatum]|uniref:melanocortin receptor 5-like n=1 Tax=Branchiostoma lanceolatum TaxID=7740 RepID=UPI0034523EDC
MIGKGKYFRIALCLVLVTTDCLGITSAPHINLNSTTDTSDVAGTGSFDSSPPQEEVSSNCSSSRARNNTSQLEENSTSAHAKCLEDQQNQSSGPNPIAVWLSYILTSVSMLAIAGNSLPIAAIVKLETLHKPVYVLMANLAASDICTSVSFLGLFFYGIHVKRPIALSRFFFTTILLSGLSSAYSLLILTAERYWFIVHGMSYLVNVTNERCVVMIVAAWVWSCFFAVLPNFGWSCTVGCISVAGAGYPPSYLVLVLVLVFIPMAAIVGLNTGIFWCLWQQVSAIKRQEAAVQANHRTSRKSSITILIITVLFLAAWLPFCVNIAGAVACQQDCSNNDDAPMLALVVLNSALNPIIYGFRLKEIRRGVKRLLFGRRAVNVLNPKKRATAFAMTTVKGEFEEQCRS